MNKPLNMLSCYLVIILSTSQYMKVRITTIFTSNSFTKLVSKWLGCISKYNLPLWVSIQTSVLVYIFLWVPKKMLGLLYGTPYHTILIFSLKQPSSQMRKLRIRKVNFHNVRENEVIKTEALKFLSTTHTAFTWAPNNTKPHKDSPCT